MKKTTLLILSLFILTSCYLDNSSSKGQEVKPDLTDIHSIKYDIPMSIGFSYQLDFINSNYRWISSDPAIAQVNESGLITSLGLGYATISAYIDGVVKKSYVVKVMEPFYTRWDSNRFHWVNGVYLNVGTIGELTLPITYSPDDNFTIYWGDGTSDHIINQTGVGITHNYGDAKDCEVRIVGKMTGWSTLNSSESTKSRLREIVKWGSFSFNSLGGHFFECDRLIITAEDKPLAPKGTSFHKTFYRAEAIRSIPNINDWDTSGVVDMSYMFYDIFYFNSDISNWKTSNVKDMSFMFFGNGKMVSDISRWDTSSVTNMSGMFGWTREYNPNVSKWEVSNVTNMAGMFHRSGNFDRDLSKWDVSKVENMAGMFSRTGFNGDVSNWKTSRVTNMSNMFLRAHRFNRDISRWDTSNVTDMAGMFHLANDFNQDIGNWDTSKVENMSRMFMYCMYHFNQDISRWDTSKVKNMSGMFESAAFNRDISRWDTSSVETMNRMFWNGDFNQDISKWDVSSVKDMTQMFGDYSVQNYDKLLNGWSKKQLQKNVTFSTFSKYSSDSQAARQNIIDNYKWIITDGGITQ